MDVRQVHCRLPRKGGVSASTTARAKFRELDAERCRHRDLDEATSAFATVPVETSLVIAATRDCHSRLLHTRIVFL
jgi:hypothetical protein